MKEQEREYISGKNTELPESPERDIFLKAFGDHFLKMVTMLLEILEESALIDDKTQRELSEIHNETFREPPPADNPDSVLHILKGGARFESMKKNLCASEWDIPDNLVGLKAYLMTGIRFYLNIYSTPHFALYTDIPDILMIDRRMLQISRRLTFINDISDGVVTNFKRRTNQKDGQRSAYKERKKPVYLAIKEFNEHTVFKNKNGKISQSSIASTIKKKISSMGYPDEAEKTYTRFLNEKNLTISVINNLNHDSEKILRALKNIN